MNKKRCLSVRGSIISLTIIIVYIIVGVYFGFNEQLTYFNEYCIIPNSINCYYINVASNPYYLIFPILKLLVVFFALGKTKNFLMRIFMVYLCLTTLLLTILGVVFPYNPLDNFLFWLVIDFLKILEIFNGVLLFIVFIFKETKENGYTFVC